MVGLGLDTPAEFGYRPTRRLAWAGTIIGTAGTSGSSPAERNKLSPASKGATKEGSSTEPGDKPGALHPATVPADSDDPSQRGRDGWC
ncbi:hypothetical protein GCM10027088_37570 [Nocardia goodfellowii]